MREEKHITKKETIPKTDTQVQNQDKIQVITYIPREVQNINKIEVENKTETKVENQVRRKVVPYIQSKI